MRARRVAAGSELELFQDKRQIGRVDGTTVSFEGFATRDDATLAASVARQALARRRADQPRTADATKAGVARAGIPAWLLPPATEGTESGSWGFEIELRPEEGVEVFAVARARVMWRALQSTGIDRRMGQFGGERMASVG